MRQSGRVSGGAEFWSKWPFGPKTKALSSQRTLIEEGCQAPDQYFLQKHKKPPFFFFGQKKQCSCRPMGSMAALAQSAQQIEGRWSIMPCAKKET